jgi:uncharacterized iron-regulated membrane protein
MCALSSQGRLSRPAFLKMEDPMAVEADHRQASGSALRLFVTRLHFYVGLFVGPFIFVAALTGTLYVLTPQIEEFVYRDQLQARSQGVAQTIAAQVSAARSAIGEGARLFAVRPATAAGRTTEVMFTQPGLGESESRAIFVDPASLAVQGDLIVYGTSGILPLRTTIDYLHRNLLLGAIGRNYSELAASWLWVAVAGGILLWIWRRRLPAGRGRAANDRRLHSLIGLWISLGLLFLSATGLTWSRFAGDHIDSFRTEVGWVTPSVSLTRSGAMEGEHAEHQAGMTMPMPSGALPPERALVRDMDRVLAAARAGGIDSPMVEVRPPRKAEQAWMVREYDRRWPSQVDTVAVDPDTFAITSRADFATFPPVAKLIRWGIDAHMGILFGLANQIVMAVLGIALMTMIVYGYRIWWIRRPAPGRVSLMRAWSYLSMPGKAVSVALAAAFGFALPLMGLSLIAFVLVDSLRWGLSGLIGQDQAKMAQ